MQYTLKRAVALMAALALVFMFGMFGESVAGTRNPCNPCAAKRNPCNPCAAKMNPCNPCAAKRNPCNPCAAKNPCGAKAAVKPIRQAHIKDQAALVEWGKKLWHDPKLGKSGLACNSCHVNYALLNLDKVGPFPHYVKMVDDIVTLDQMINFCMINPMKTEPLDPNGLTMTALAAYYQQIVMDYKAGKGLKAAAKMNPCNPCAAKMNPCAAKMNPCNPCAAKMNPCNPCAAKMNPCAAKMNPCNPCAAKMNPCNPCSGKK